MPDHLQLPALTVCLRERIAYNLVGHGTFGTSLAMTIYPKIERDTKAARNIAFYYGNRLLYKNDTEVIKLYEKEVEISRKAYGDSDPRTIMSLLSLAIPYRETRQFQKSMDCANEVIKTFEGKPLNEEVVTAYRHLSYNLSEMEDYEKAISVNLKLIALEEAVGEMPMLTILDRQMLSFNYRDSGQQNKQAEVLKTIEDIRIKAKHQYPSVRSSAIPYLIPSKDDNSDLFELIK
ncbi:MAG: tetratricopeptide repeat protein [Candidatus Obscuribacterales bacterium]|nr:tetratricopeptide repeat protein [Candidatus Obscuribacterales bacterium]